LARIGAYWRVLARIGAYWRVLGVLNENIGFVKLKLEFKNFSCDLQIDYKGIQLNEKS
jgi:hypothetical protein